MKQTVIVNTNGLWDRFPQRNVEVSAGGGSLKKDYSCFYEISSENQEALWGEAMEQKVPFIKSTMNDSNQ